MSQNQISRYNLRTRQAGPQITVSAVVYAGGGRASRSSAKSKSPGAENSRENVYPQNLVGYSGSESDAATPSPAPMATSNVSPQNKGVGVSSVSSASVFSNKPPLAAPKPIPLSPMKSAFSPVARPLPVSIRPPRGSVPPRASLSPPHSVSPPPASPSPRLSPPLSPALSPSRSSSSASSAQGSAGAGRYKCFASDCEEHFEDSTNFRLHLSKHSLGRAAGVLNADGWIESL